MGRPQSVVHAVALLTFAVPCWADDIYVDPAWSGPETGTFENPYNSWGDFTITAGNDYRQKCGTSYSGSLTVDARGTSSDSLIVGAYYDNGGMPSHEDATPHFGQNCGDGSPKPIMRRSAREGYLIISAEGGDQYLEVHSLQLRDANLGVFVRSNRTTIRYCFLHHLAWGIRVGLDAGDHDGEHTVIEDNFIDLDEDQDESGSSWDAVELGVRAAFCTVQRNHMTGFDHGGISIFRSDDHLIQENYIYGSGASAEDFCCGHNVNADRNTIRFNLCDNAGMGHEIMGGNDNDIYGNIYICDARNFPQEAQGCVQFQSEGEPITSSNNRFYNNTVYDNDNHDKNVALMFYSSATNTGDVSGNEIFNNIFLKTTSYCIRVSDNNDVIGTNLFHNNLCFDHEADRFAFVEGSIYADAAEFNGRNDAEGNLDVNPQLSDPLAGQLWPADSSSPVVNAGRSLDLSSLGLHFDSVWVPTVDVRTIARADHGGHDIGAYEYAVSSGGTGAGGEGGTGGSSAGTGGAGGRGTGGASLPPATGGFAAQPPSAQPEVAHDSSGCACQSAFSSGKSPWVLAVALVR